MTKQKRVPSKPFAAIGGTKMDGYTRPRLSSLDMKDLPYKDDSLERLYVQDTLDQTPIEDVAAIIEEMNRVLKADGVLMIVGTDYDKTEEAQADWKHTTENVLIILTSLGWKAQEFEIASPRLDDWPLSDRDENRYVVAATMWRSEEELEELRKALEEAQKAQEQQSEDDEPIEGVVVNP